MVQLDVVDIQALNVCPIWLPKFIRFTSPQRTLTTQHSAPAPAAPIQSLPTIIAPAPVSPAQNAGNLLQNRDPLAIEPIGLYPNQQPPVSLQDMQTSPIASSIPSSISQELLNAIPEDQKVCIKGKFVALNWLFHLGDAVSSDLDDTRSDWAIAALRACCIYSVGKGP
jgi:hypothetical protein